MNDEFSNNTSCILISRQFVSMLSQRYQHNSYKITGSCSTEFRNSFAAKLAREYSTDNQQNHYNSVTQVVMGENS